MAAVRPAEAQNEPAGQASHALADAAERVPAAHATPVALPLGQ